MTRNIRWSPNWTMNVDWAWETITMDCERPDRNIVPFTSRWHVIQEVDIIGLVSEQVRRAVLCDRLEAMADALPAHASQGEIETLDVVLAELFTRERHVALMTLLSRGPSDPLKQALLDHLRVQDLEDAATARELIDALTPATASDHAISPETLGYMLRGIFTGCRRAIDFEQLAILTLAGHRMTPAARMLLVDALSLRPRD